MRKEESMKIPKLKPCPFCGAKPEKTDKNGKTEVYHRDDLKRPCFFCYHGDSGYWIEAGEGAAWNRRKP